MKLVIDMDDSEYKEILKDGNVNFLRIIKAIKNGTPIPKGLIDAKRLKAEVYRVCMDDYFMPTKLMTCDDITDIIDKVGTIIEADTTRDCKTCGHSNEGKCAYTEECHECMWVNKYIEAGGGEE